MSEWWETLNGWGQTATGSLGVAGALGVIGLVIGVAARPDEELRRIIRNLAIGFGVVAALAGIVAVSRNGDGSVVGSAPSTVSPAQTTTTFVGLVTAPPAPLAPVPLTDRDVLAVVSALLNHIGAGEAEQARSLLGPDEQAVVDGLQGTGYLGLTDDLEDAVLRNPISYPDGSMEGTVAMFADFCSLELRHYYDVRVKVQRGPLIITYTPTLTGEEGLPNANARQRCGLS